VAVNRSDRRLRGERRSESEPDVGPHTSRPANTSAGREGRLSDMVSQYGTLTYRGGARTGSPLRVVIKRGTWGGDPLQPELAVKGEQGRKGGGGRAFFGRGRPPGSRCVRLDSPGVPVAVRRANSGCPCSRGERNAKHGEKPRVREPSAVGPVPPTRWKGGLSAIEKMQSESWARIRRRSWDLGRGVVSDRGRCGIGPGDRRARGGSARPGAGPKVCTPHPSGRG